MITSIGASRENRTHTILITSQAQYHCAREAYISWCGWIGHYPVVVIKDTCALNPFQTSELDLGLLVLLAATSSWYLTRASNPEEVTFELTMSASCISQACLKPSVPVSVWHLDSGSNAEPAI